MGLTYPLLFSEFGLFVNTKYLHNIRDNKLNQTLLIYSFFIIGPLSMANAFTNFLENRSGIRFETERQTDRQTDKQTNRQTQVKRYPSGGGYDTGAGCSKVN